MLTCAICLLGREKDSAIVAAKGNDHQIDGRAKNSNVGTGWTHKEGSRAAIIYSIIIIIY